MKIDELRIGNYVNIEGDVVKVKEIYEKSIHYANGEYESYATEDFMQPIELTEEVLLKIGFVKENEVNRMYNNCCVVSYYINKFYKELVIEVRRENGFYKNNMVHYDIKYLHELQNTYYLLTGEELEVEL